MSRSGEVLDDIGFYYDDGTTRYSAGDGSHEGDEKVQRIPFDEDDPPSSLTITWVPEDDK